MPFKSLKQNAWAHSPAGVKALGGKAKVKEWENATNYSKLPEYKHRDIKMSEKSVAKEHKKLIPILQHGSREELREAAREQKNEMKGYGIKMRNKTIEPNKKNQKPIVFKEGGLHASTKTAGSKKISSSKHAEAKSGKLGPKAKKQEMFYENVLKHRKAKRDISDEARMSANKSSLMQFGDSALLNKGQKAFGNADSTAVKGPQVRRKAKRGLSKKFGNNNPNLPQLPDMDENGQPAQRKKRNLGYTKIKVGSPMVGKTSIPTPAERKLRERIQKRMGNVRSNFRL